MHKINWDTYFFSIAILSSQRSPDIHTQCGCVIVRDKTILSTGYNGFIRNALDEVLPVTRPEKYDFMIHAEHNAILNCARQGKSTLKAVAYVTGRPCLYCWQYLWQAGISKVVYTDISHPKMIDTEEYHNKLSLLFKAMCIDRPFKTMDIIFVPSKHLELELSSQFLASKCISKRNDSNLICENYDNGERK